MPVDGGLAVFAAANGNPGIVPATIPVDRGGYTGRVDAAAVGADGHRDPRRSRSSACRPRERRRCANSSRPTSAAGSRCPAPTGPLAALDADPGPARRAGTVLLLPGYTGSKEDFAPILDPLCDNGFRAVAIDLPGQFESAGSGRRGRLRAAGAGPGVRGRRSPDLAATGPVVLLGHSFGGLVARGAVLAGAPVGRSDPAVLRAGRLQLRRSGYDALRTGEPDHARARQGRGLRQHGGRPAEAARKTVPAEVAALLRRRFLRRRARPGCWAWAPPCRPNPTGSTSCAAASGRSGTPVAVIAGRDDDAWPLTTQRDMAARLGTELVLDRRRGALPRGGEPGRAAGRPAAAAAHLDRRPPADRSAS